MHLRIKEVSHFHKLQVHSHSPRDLELFHVISHSRVLRTTTALGQNFAFPRWWPIPTMQSSRALSNFRKMTKQRAFRITCQVTRQVTQLGFPTAKRTTPTAFACLALSSSCVPANSRRPRSTRSLRFSNHETHAAHFTYPSRIPILETPMEHSDRSSKLSIWTFAEFLSQTALPLLSQGWL